MAAEPGRAGRSVAARRPWGSAARRAAASAKIARFLPRQWEACGARRETQRVPLAPTRRLCWAGHARPVRQGTKQRRRSHSTRNRSAHLRKSAAARLNRARHIGGAADIAKRRASRSLVGCFEQRPVAEVGGLAPELYLQVFMDDETLAHIGIELFMLSMRKFLYSAGKVR